MRYIWLMSRATGPLTVFLRLGQMLLLSAIDFSSFAGLLFNDVYAASKFAVEGLCESLAVQAMKFNIK